MLQEERCLRYLWIICQSTVVAFRPLLKKIRKFFRCLNAKVCYKSRGALGTSGSFVNQPSWQPMQCVWTVVVSLKSSYNFLCFHHKGRKCWGLYLLPPIKTVFFCGGKFWIRNDSLHHHVVLPQCNLLSVPKQWM